MRNADHEAPVWGEWADNIDTSLFFYDGLAQMLLTDAVAQRRFSDGQFTDSHITNLYG